MKDLIQKILREDYPRRTSYVDDGGEHRIGDDDIGKDTINPKHTTKIILINNYLKRVNKDIFGEFYPNYYDTYISMDSGGFIYHPTVEKDVDGQHNSIDVHYTYDEGNGKIIAQVMVMRNNKIVEHLSKGFGSGDWSSLRFISDALSKYSGEI